MRRSLEATAHAHRSRIQVAIFEIVLAVTKSGKSTKAVEPGIAGMLAGNSQDNIVQFAGLAADLHAYVEARTYGNDGPSGQPHSLTSVLPDVVVGLLGVDRRRGRQLASMAAAIDVRGSAAWDQGSNPRRGSASANSPPGGGGGSCYDRSGGTSDGTTAQRTYSAFGGGG